MTASSLLPFSGKVALIAGASRGIGAVTARAFADAGAAVVLAARDRQALDSRTKTIRVSCPSSDRYVSCSTVCVPRVHMAGYSATRLGALDLENLADRVIKPILKANGVQWKGWQAYRRGLATNLKKLGVPDTTIQAILRHESVSTTQRFYIKTAREDTVDAMKQLEAKIACAANVQQVSVT
jgi:NAD(P)-dependent dehydrogenase (short-subunit alcohol dehydrogenase family)